MRLASPSRSAHHLLGLLLSLPDLLPGLLADLVGMLAPPVGLFGALERFALSLFSILGGVAGLSHPDFDGLAPLLLVAGSSGLDGVGCHPLELALDGTAPLHRPVVGRLVDAGRSRRRS